MARELLCVSGRGLISSLLVAGFTGCGVIFYLLDLIFKAVGGTRCTPASPAMLALEWT